MIQLIKDIPFLYRLGLLIKHGRWRARTRKRFEKYIGECTIPKLQLGAGLNELSGWFNTDYFARSGIFFLDVTKKFPFPDNTFELIFSEHHIEHITYQQAQLMLAEAYRVIKPGGFIKITTPDLQKYIHAYATQGLRSPMIHKHVAEWIYNGFAYAATYKPVGDDYQAHFVNDIFLNYEHRFIYDRNALKALLEKAGFNIVNEPGKNDSCFAGNDTHVSDFDLEFTLCLYAEK